MLCNVLWGCVIPASVARGSEGNLQCCRSTRQREATSVASCRLTRRWTSKANHKRHKSPGNGREGNRYDPHGCDSTTSIIKVYAIRMRWTGQLQYLKLVSSQRTHMIMRDGDLRRWTKDAIELACPFPSLGGTRQLRRTLEMAVGIDRFKKTPTYLPLPIK